MELMRQQTARFNTEIINKDFLTSDFSKRPFLVKTDNREYLGKAIIIATGADTKWLGVPGEDRLRGKGVSSCAPCDAFFYKGKKVIVVGGGDSAMEEALVLAKFASSVTIVHRRNQFRASKIMQDRVKNARIKVIWNTLVKEIIGSDKVTAIKLETKNKGEWEKLIDGVFVAIGHIPNTANLKGIKLDQKGFVKRKEIYDKNGLLLYSSATNISGVFVAGDVHDYRYKQAVTAAGFGCIAAMDAEKWLEENSQSE
jgi:thioredoxin reductase (NADPH)